MPSPKIFCILIVLIFGAYSVSFASEERTQQLRWLENANPIADAYRAIENKDYRFKAVYGEAIIIPGVAPEKQAFITDKFGVSPIEGTSDDLSGEECIRLVTKAYDYAEIYNKTLLEKLGPNGGL